MRAIIISPLERPSRPSVILNAFANDSITIVENGIYSHPKVISPIRGTWTNFISRRSYNQYDMKNVRTSSSMSLCRRRRPKKSVSSTLNVFFMSSYNPIIANEINVKRRIFISSLIMCGYREVIGCHGSKYGRSQKTTPNSTVVVNIMRSPPPNGTPALFR